MARVAQAFLVVVAALALAGCGSRPRDAAGVAACLNDRGFLVQASGKRIDGTSPDGVALTLHVRAGRASTLDTSGAPGGARLTSRARDVVASCLESRGPRPGTLTAPAAR